MKILMVSLLKRKVDPEISAARPRMIYELIKQLQKKGHEITLIGTGDSQIPGVKIIPVIKKSFVELPVFENPFYAETAYLVKLAKTLENISGEFDVIHNHTYPEFINLLVDENLKSPMVTTVHAQMTSETDEALSFFPNSKLIAISESAKSLARKAKIWRVIYNGVDTELYQYKEKKEDYLLWIGRLGKAKDDKGNFIDAKGVRWAITLAEKIGCNLKISGNVEDIEFYNKDVKPHLSEKVKFVSPISTEQPLAKEEIVELMQNAKAFLMTVNWEEPFGLVMAEAMSCGTPVIGFKRGSVPELVKDGVTGFVVDPDKGIEGLADAYKKLDSIKPTDCRHHIEENFSVEKMAKNYEKAYVDATQGEK